MSNPKPDATALNAAIDEQLLKTVGVARQDATSTDLMKAIAQVARRTTLAALGGNPDRRSRQQGPARVLPVDGVSDRPHPVQRAGRPASD